MGKPDPELEVLKRVLRSRGVELERVFKWLEKDLRTDYIIVRQEIRFWYRVGLVMGKPMNAIISVKKRFVMLRPHSEWVAKNLKVLDPRDPHSCLSYGYDDRGDPDKGWRPSYWWASRN